MDMVDDLFVVGDRLNPGAGPVGAQELPQLFGENLRLGVRNVGVDPDVNAVLQSVAADHKEERIARIMAGGQGGLDRLEIFLLGFLYRLADLFHLQECQVGLRLRTVGQHPDGMIVKNSPVQIVTLQRE